MPRSSTRCSLPRWRPSSRRWTTSRRCFASSPTSPSFPRRSRRRSTCGSSWRRWAPSTGTSRARCTSTWPRCPEAFVVSADRDQMKRVFANLFTNAIQAMPEGGRLSVRADMVKKAQKAFCRIAVSDTGVGHPRVGNRQHLRPVLHDEEGRHGPRPGNRAAHRLRSRRQRVGGKRRVAGHHVLHRPAGIGGHAAVSTILIIDDEPGIRTVLRDVLEDEGHTVLAAEDGIRGLGGARRRGRSTSCSWTCGCPTWAAWTC